MVTEVEGILPASTHEEVEVLLRYLNQDEIRIVEISGEWSMPTLVWSREIKTRTSTRELSKLNLQRGFH